MGYYPNGLYATTGLRDEANQVNWGGEVFDAQSHPTTTATDMGSGLFPWEGYSRAAFMRNLMLLAGRVHAKPDDPNRPSRHDDRFHRLRGGRTTRLLRHQSRPQWHRCVGLQLLLGRNGT